MKRIKYIAQIQQTECGLSVITMLLNYYGLHYSLYDVRQFVEVGRDGMSAGEVIDVFRELGLRAEPFRCRDIHLLKKLRRPFIIATEKRHLVIVDKVSDNAVYVIDPAVGRVKYSYSELSEIFDGICIEVSPGDKLKKKKKEYRMFKILFPFILEKKRQYFIFILLSFFNYLVMIALPISIQKFVDGVYDYAGLHRILLIVFMTAVLYLISNLLVKFHITNLKIDIDRKANIKVINHMVNLPYVFFDTRKKSDIIYTLNHVSSIREVLVTDFLSAILNVGVLVIIWIYFFVSNRTVAVALNVALLPNVLLAIASQNILTKNMRKLVIENSSVQGYQTEMLYAMFAIKTGGTEENAFEEWREKYCSYSQKYGYNEKLSAIWNTVLNMSQTLSPLFVLVIGIVISKRNMVTMGEIIALFSLAEIFFSQIYDFFNSVLNIGINSVYIERLGDILFAKQRIKSEETAKKIDEITGIKLQNICFRYTEKTKYVLNKINFEMKKGDVIAIVGKSGSGKSTLLKVISGLYDFSDGEILINGKKSSEIETKTFIKQVGIVPQESYLFNKTIFQNIAGDRKEIESSEVEEVLKIVNIYDEVMQMPMGLNTIISEMGTNLSGGQRQRIVIARELLKHPSLLLLDEATSALDYINEKQILESISKLGITTLIVTHRLSSIQGADNILFMKEGEIVEQGKHSELMEKNGFYFRMYNDVR